MVKFDLNLKIKNGQCNATIPTSTIQNFPPTVTPPSASFQGADFVWLADPFGEINMTGPATTLLAVPDDSVLVFSLSHINASIYGFLTKSTADGTPYTNQPPTPFGGNLGIPNTFELDLKRQVPYIKKTGFYGQLVYVSFVPK